MADGATIDIQGLSLVFGPHKLQGRANGQWLTIVPTREAFSMNVGIDGEGFYIKNADFSATITATLQQSSDSNDILSGFHLADRVTPGGLLLPLVFTDLETKGRTVAMAARARITKQADGTWSDGGETRTWTFITTRLEFQVGGVASGALNPGDISVP